MTKKLILLSILVSAIAAILILATKVTCTITEKESIEIAREFINKLNLDIKPEPVNSHGEQYIPIYRVLKSKSNAFDVLMKFLSNDNVCMEVVVDSGWRYGIRKSVAIGSNKEVVRCTDSETSINVFKRYHISPDNRIPRKWPPFLSRDKAISVMNNYASKIGLPPDVKFSNATLNAEEGEWTAVWHRTLNGYEYEHDHISITIMAVDGEFYSYNKLYQGKPCRTTLKVTKDEAIAKGWKIINKSLKWYQREKLESKYDITYAELKIAQPNTIFGFTLPWPGSRSRLAWVIIAKIKDTDDKNKFEKGYPDGFVIYVDAADKSIIGDITLKCR